MQKEQREEFHRDNSLSSSREDNDNSCASESDGVQEKSADVPSPTKSESAPVPSQAHDDCCLWSHQQGSFLAWGSAEGLLWD